MTLNSRITPSLGDSTIRRAVVDALVSAGLQVPEFQSIVAYKQDQDGSFVPCDPEKNIDGNEHTTIEINPIEWKKRIVS